MTRPALFACALVLLLAACGSSSSDNGSSGSTSGGTGTCPDVSGEWKITKHCEAALVGLKLTVTETSCNLSFAAPFNGFSGSVAADGKIALSGPQTCSGTASNTSVVMNCTPGTCAVELVR